MKAVLLLILLSPSLLQNVFSQDAKTFYDQGMEKARAGKLEEALVFLDKSIELNQTEWVAWYNRGLVKAMLNDYEGALPDYEQVVKLNPDNKKGYLNRGTAKKHLTDYTGAINDFTLAIGIDPAYSDAFFNRGLVYEMLDKKDSACTDFKKAQAFGDKYADKKIERCNDNSPRGNSYYSILRLTKQAENKNYGFTQEDPIKVGTGPNGGPANQRAFLDLLRDPNGKPLKYTRLGSCCMYDSPNGLMGKGVLDKYEITYKNEKGETEKSILYISFDDYEELKIPYGLKTLPQK
ncbi:MAG: tetratricopeptide repeat protein [Ferruginibacter sp.]